MKCVIIFIGFLLFGDTLVANVVMSKGFASGGKHYHETWYLGSNEQEFKYHKYGGGAVDDGLFVAIPNGGGYNGYSYYEIKHPATGLIDGGPAYLPNDPGSLPVTGFSMIVNGHGSGQRLGFLRTWRGGVPELPDGSIIPIGSKFFYWLSGGGSFSLTTSVLEKKIELEQKVEVKKDLVATETFEESLVSISEESEIVQEVIEQLVNDIEGIEDFLKDIDKEDKTNDAILYKEDPEYRNEF